MINRTLHGLLFVLLLGAHAEAAPIILKLAHVAPDGSAWAREIAAAGREVESVTNGELKLKIYPSGIAGDELEVSERLQKGGIDVAVSGGPLCQQTAPTLTLLRLPGRLNDREETNYVLGKLMPVIQEEARRSGLVITHTLGLGPDILFTRRPLRTLAEIKATPLWRWSEEPRTVQMVTAMGLKIVSLPINEAARAYDKGATDGFWALPVAALVWRWSAQAKYFIPDLHASYLSGCILVSSASWGRLTFEQQNVFTSVVAKYVRRVEEMGTKQDDALLNGLFEKQGLQARPASEKLRAEFFQAARELRDHLDEKVAPRAMLDRVQQLILDYRSEHARK